jgi:hypothetical protein
LEADSIVKVNGQKICTILKTKKNNALLGRAAEYTVYDVTGAPRFLLEGFYGNLLFLDDNLSFIYKPCKGELNALAAYFASDSILTPTGYNMLYREIFILKQKGYNQSTAKPRDKRDKTLPLNYFYPYIIQDNCIVAIYNINKDYSKETNTALIYNRHRGLMYKIITYQLKTPYTHIQTDIYNKDGMFLLSYTNNNSNFYLSDEEFKKGIEWLILKKDL